MCSLSKLPHPSSIAIKLGLGNAETLINATLIANELINRSIPEVNSNGQKLSSSYIIYPLIFLPSVFNTMLKSTT